jgi:cytochrome c oxidase assembly factor CtaG
VALLTLALVSPLDAVGDQYLMSAHMLQHVLIGDAALALGLLALRGPLGLFLLPPFVLRPLGHSRPARAALAFVLRPSVAIAAWVLAMGLWHVPRAYDYAVGHDGAHKLEHLSFVVAGTLVWAQLIDPARRGRLGLAQRIGFAGLLFALGTALADTLIFSFHPLYPTYAQQGVRLWGISPLRDQQLAGLVMMGEQLVALGICVALLLRALVHRRPAAAPRGGAAQART